MALGAAALEHVLDRRLEEDNTDTRASQQLGVCGLDEGAPAESNHRGRRHLLQHPAQGLGFDFAKLWLTVPPEEFSNGRLLVEFNLMVKIEEGPAQQRRQRTANAGFAGA